MIKKRTIFRSLNFTFVIILLGYLFIMVNWVSSRRYVRVDLSSQKLSQLSDQTLRLLESLEEPVTITVFYEQSHRLFGLLRDLLDTYEQKNPALTIRYVDPQHDVAQARLVVEQLGIEEINLIVVQAGDRKQYLPETELADYDLENFTVTGKSRVLAFKGEDVISSAILSVTQATTPTVWLTTGHGEKDLEDETPEGLSSLKRYLSQQNVSLETVMLAQRNEIGEEVALIAIIGPTHPFLEDEVSLLSDYLDAGGRLLILLDPLTETGLDALLTRWGIIVGDDIVVDAGQQVAFVSAGNLFITTYAQHPIVEKMKTLMTLFPLARSVMPAAISPEGITVKALALTTDQGWGETRTDAVKFEYQEGEDLEGPVSVAVAADRKEPPSRIVVFGDADFVINGQLNNAGNKDIILAASRWLLAQEQLIGIGPKTLESVKLNLTHQQLWQLFWIVLFGMPALCGIAGGATWFRRRK